MLVAAVPGRVHRGAGAGERADRVAAGVADGERPAGQVQVADGAGEVGGSSGRSSSSPGRSPGAGWPAAGGRRGVVHRDRDRGGRAGVAPLVQRTWRWRCTSRPRRTPRRCSCRPSWRRRRRCCRTRPACWPVKVRTTALPLSRIVTVQLVWDRSCWTVVVIAAASCTPGLLFGETNGGAPTSASMTGTSTNWSGTRRTGPFGLKFAGSPWNVTVRVWAPPLRTSPVRPAGRGPRCRSSSTGRGEGHRAVQEERDRAGGQPAGPRLRGHGRGEGDRLAERGRVGRRRRSRRWRRPESWSARPRWSLVVHRELAALDEHDVVAERLGELAASPRRRR